MIANLTYRVSHDWTPFIQQAIDDLLEGIHELEAVK